MNQQSDLSLVEAVAEYLASKEVSEETGKRRTIQGELNRFIRWCGRDCRTSSLKPTNIEEYCATLERTGEESGERLAVTKAFLTYLHSQGATKGNLSSHAKLRRSTRLLARSQRRNTETPMQVTSEYYQQMADQLEVLKGNRVKIAQDIRKAAADKDVSENAPLDAAREQQGHLESRIRELENNLQRATLLEKNLRKAARATKASMGSRVSLKHALSGKRILYLLVDSSEADPSNGKLSIASPVGKAILKHKVGDTVEVATPSGTVNYLITKII